MMNFLFRAKIISNKDKGGDCASEAISNISKNTSSGAAKESKLALTTKARCMDFDDGRNIIKVYDNKISTDLLENASQVVQKNGFTYGWRSNDGIGTMFTILILSHVITAYI
jgi:hypothetical protein